MRRPARVEKRQVLLLSVGVRRYLWIKLPLLGLVGLMWGVMLLICIGLMVWFWSGFV